MAGEFEQLLPCSWRGIEFPVSSVEASFQQDLAEHKYYGVDGASVEATGRSPMMFTATCPMVNGIVPGKNEKWGVLYPTTFRKLLVAVADRKTGIFVHPELDQITCKVRSAEFKHDANQRDGVVLTLHFVETVEDILDSVNLFAESPVAVAQLAALDLDANQESLAQLVPDRYQVPFTLESFLDSLTAIGDQFSIKTKLAAGKLDQIGYHIGRLEDSTVRARSAIVWPVIDACQRATSALRWIEEHPPAGRPVLLHEVREDVSLASLIGEIPGANFNDIVKLNPRIMAEPVVDAGTFVRYYEPR